MILVRRLARLVPSLLVASIVAACATSVDDLSGADLFADGDDAGADARAATDAGRVIPSSDAGVRAEASVPPPLDGAASDADVVADTASPPAVDSAPPVGDACPSANGKYTIAYFIALAALPDGGSLPPCPCPVSQCCYTPLGASAVCLAL